MKSYAVEGADNDAFASFHWLQAPKRIKFKLAVIVYTETSAALLLGICVISSATLLIYRREVNFGRQLPDFSTSALHDSSLSVTAHYLLTDHVSGTAYLKTSSH